MFRFITNAKKQTQQLQNHQYRDSQKHTTYKFLESDFKYLIQFTAKIRKLTWQNFQMHIIKTSFFPIVDTCLSCKDTAR